MDELEPGHVKLRSGGAAPLSCFEEDYTDRLTLEANIFKHRDEPALWVSEAEEAVGLADVFVFDINERSGPEWEIVKRAEADELGYDSVAVVCCRVGHSHDVAQQTVDTLVSDKSLDESIVGHRSREPLVSYGEIIQGNKDTLTDRTLAGDGVEAREHRVEAFGIFGHYIRDCNHLFHYRTNHCGF